LFAAPIVLEGGLVGLLPVILSALTSILAYTLLAVGVYKLYTIANELSEIKKLLRDRPGERKAPQLDVEAILRE
jgi:biopolymer transport protein ExbB/TolQ